MGFLKSMLGLNSSSHEKLLLQDDQLGTFTALNNDGTRIIWRGITEVFDEKVSLFINGDKKHLDNSGKASIQNILRNEKIIASEIERSLKDQYKDADKEYLNWKTHFNCISISATGNGVSITMEEKDSYHNFNIQFADNKAIDVTIDT